MRTLDNGICPFSQDEFANFGSCVKESCALWSATGLEDENSEEIWACAFRVIAEAVASRAHRLRSIPGL